jgi:hypothetical protein
MERHRAVTLTLALGLALVAGPALAGPGTQYAGEEIGKIRYINRTQNLVVLNDGMEFHATDSKMLDGLREGELVKVDFSYNGERAFLNSIEAASPDDTTGASPATDPGPHEH